MGLLEVQHLRLEPICQLQEHPRNKSNFSNPPSPDLQWPEHPAALYGLTLNTAPGPGERFVYAGQGRLQGWESPHTCWVKIFQCGFFGECFTNTPVDNPSINSPIVQNELWWNHALVCNWDLRRRRGHCLRLPQGRTALNSWPSAASCSHQY